jgi:hypothetical protein
MADYYFTTSSNSNTPEKHLFAKVNVSNKWYYYSIPLSSVKASFVILSNNENTADTTGDSSRLYIEDLQNQSSQIVPTTSTSDTIYIHGVEPSISPNNALGIYNAFTGSGIF